MTDRYEYLRDLCKDFLLVDETTAEQLEVYEKLLTEWNKKINLTAITDPDEIVIKHFYDSLLVLKNVDIPENSSIIDVGTGAGFPGMVLKIVRPDLNVTLLDGLNKRLVFLGEVAKQLQLDCNIVHSRAEDAAKKAEYREKFDFAFARAVAKLNVISEYCIPYLRIGGKFIALKGPGASEEVAAADNAVKILGGESIITKTDYLPDKSERNLCIIKKISQTSPEYPRNSAKISKKPL